MLRFTIPLFAGVLIAAGMTPSASAQTIDFDRFANGQQVPAGTAITSQYSSLGVTFSSPAPAGGPTAIADGEASSAPNFVSAVDGSGAGVYPIEMSFAPPYTNWVDVTLISIGCATVTSTAYSSDNTVLDSISLSRGPGAGVGLGNHDRISLDGPAIARVRFEITQPCNDGFGIDDVAFSLFSGVPFSDFRPTATLTLKPGTGDDVLIAKGTFALGSASDGIDPLTEDVTVLIGRFSRTIHAGLFKVDSTGAYSFKGTVGGAALTVKISPPAAGVYTFSATAKSTDLPSLSSTVSVGFRIGNDGGDADLSTVKVTATR
jgi:hypothetical protein